MATTTTLEIHPAIGIARMGSSDEYFIGPEPGLPIEKNRRDATADRLLKRQAARFRVYSCVRDEHGTLVSFEELTPTKATITWSVHLVNRKAAAPRFLNDANVPNTDPTLRRNGATGNDIVDKPLIIDGGIQSLTGPLQPRKIFLGQFKGNDLPRGLGEMSTDADGRLVVVGGFGISRSFPTTVFRDFVDNDNWHDDTSDGPVEATVHFLDGRPDQAVDKPAWVIACQPDFAPGIDSLVTLYDAFVDVAITRSVLTMPTFKPAYDRDILPLLNRAAAYQWVNSYARDAHAPGKPGDFASIPSLGDPTIAVPKRKNIFRLLRNPTGSATPLGTPAMPSLFSDDYPSRAVLPLTRPQYRILLEWSKDAFDSTGPTQPELEPDAVTRVALEACAGGAFYPGIEAGRKIRDASIYAPNEVFRFDHAVLKPGGLTESMALPWQADFSDCTWEPPAPPAPALKGRGWWPAQRPDHVLKNPADTTMVDWDRGAKGMQSMVDLWDQLGVVLEDSASSTFIEFPGTRTLPDPP